MKKTIYIFNEGSLKRKDNTLCFVSSKNKIDIPIERISEIYVFSELNFNTSLINILSKYGIAIHYFNYYSYYIGSYYPKDKVLSGSLLVKQVSAYTDNKIRLDIAKRIIEGASFNIYRNLRYYNSRGKDVQHNMNVIEFYRKEIAKVNSIDELMGYEGNIRKTYYDSWNILIDQDINFEKRVKHPPDNMINTLISFVNSLIYTRVLREIYITQLNPTISYLHQPGDRRYSLALDISEIFKPLIGDRLIFSLLNKKQITEKSFTKGLECLHLKEDAAKLIITELDNRLEKTIMHRELNKKVSYKYLIRLECFKLIKYISNEKEYIPFKIWW